MSKPIATLKILRDIASCLSGVEQTVENIAHDCRISLNMAHHGIHQLKERGIKVRKGNRVLDPLSRQRIEGLCATWDLWEEVMPMT